MESHGSGLAPDPFEAASDCAVRDEQIATLLATIARLERERDEALRQRAEVLRCGVDAYCADCTSREMARLKRERDCAIEEQRAAMRQWGASQAALRDTEDRLERVAALTSEYDRSEADVLTDIDAALSGWRRTT